MHREGKGRRRIIVDVVEGVGEFLRTSPLVAPAGVRTVVSAERDHASKVVALGIVGSGGVDGNRARLWHDELAPRVEGGFEINRQHRCKIDQLNRPDFCYAMPVVADLQRNFVNAVRELTVRWHLGEGVAVGEERGAVGRVVATVEDTGTIRNDIVVQ